MEEIGCVHARGMTVFGIVACNRFEVTEAELLTPHPKNQLQHGSVQISVNEMKTGDAFLLLWMDT